MAHPTLEYIKGLRKSLEVKKAEIVGESPASIPGAEHDKAVSADAKTPDPETKDQTMVPNSGLTTAGAGDDSPITHTRDLVAGESALTPDKQPEVTDEADAKTAESIVNDILAAISEKRAADGEALITDKGTEPEQTASTPEADKKPEVTSDAMSGGEKDSKCCGKCDGEKKCAGTVDLELTQGVLAKIAAVILSTEEGTALAERTLAKAAGAEAAYKTLGFLQEQNELAEKQAEYEAGQQDIMALLQKQAEDEEVAEALGEISDALDEAVDAGELTEDEADAAAEEIAAALGTDVPEDEIDGGTESFDDADAGAGADEDLSLTEDEAAAGLEEISATLDDLVAQQALTEEEADAAIAEIATALVGGDAEAEKTAQAMAPEMAQQSADPAAANAAIDQAVAVPPEQFDPSSVPQGPLDGVTVEDVGNALATLTQSGEITPEEAQQMLGEITADAGVAAQDEQAEVSPEEIATALQEAVQSGELTPQDVQAVLSELEGIPADDGAAEEAQATAAPMQ